MLRTIWDLCKTIQSSLFQSTTRTYTVGASVTLSDLIELFTKEAAKAGNTGGFNELKKYMYRVASFPIRNVST